MCISAGAMPLISRGMSPDTDCGMFLLQRFFSKKKLL